MSPRDYGLEDELGDDEGIDFDGPPNRRLGEPTRCTCNARSEEPCAWCSRPGPEDFPPPAGLPGVHVGERPELDDPHSGGDS